MSNYTKGTNFATKDALPTGNSLKIVSGTEIDTEFSNIETAVNTKADTTAMTAADALKANTASPTFTGVPAAPTATAGTNTTQVATTAFVATEANLKANIAGFESTGIDDNATSTAVTVDSSGNVGIGTSSPAAKLDVEGAGHIQRLKSTSANGGYASLLLGASGANIGSFGSAFQTEGGAVADLNIRAESNLTFNAGGAVEAMRISAAGNVGIGTSSPTAILDVRRSDASGKIAEFHNSTGYGVEIGTSTAEAYIQSGNLQALILGSHNTERMRIDNTGNVLVGGASALGADTITLGTGGFAVIRNTSGSCLELRRDSTDGSILDFQKDGIAVGTISVTASATSYNTSSDYRLKTNVTPMTGATAAVKLLKPCNFDWISSGDNVNGFLAHELAEVVPEATTGTKDAMRDEEYEVTPATGDVFTAGSEAGFTEVSPAISASPAYYDVDGNVIKAEVIAQAAVHEAYEAVAEVIHSADVEQPETLEEGQQWRETTAQVMATRSVPDMQGIDQAKIVPLLTATIQELIARIETLEGM